MSLSDDITPPWSEPAEKSVLGGLLITPSAIATAVELLDDRDFFRDAHRRIFRAMVRLWECGIPIEPVSLSDHLANEGDLDVVGGAPYLADLWDYNPAGAASLEYHAKIVTRLAALRSLIEAGTAIVQAGYRAGNREADAVFADAERLLGEATPASRGRPMVWVKEHLWPAMERIEMLGTEREEKRLGTGLRALDDLTGGFRRGDLVVVAGRPSMGKSALGVCNIIGHAAIMERQVCALFTAETNLPDVTDRLLASFARVNISAARRRHQLRDDDYPRLAQAAGLLNTAPIYFEHETRSINGMRAKLRRMKRELGRVDVIGVDYLQMMEAPQFGVNRLQEVSYISRELKKMAAEFDAVMVAMAQLSRAVEARPDKRPMMSDLRESGTIEADADAILLLYRPEYYFGPTQTIGKGAKAQTTNVEGKAEIIVGKMRDGATGTAHVAFAKEYTLFEDLREYDYH